MAIDRTDCDEREARLTFMIEEFRAAQKRALVKRGVILWDRTEAAQKAGTLVGSMSPKDKLKQ